MSFVTPFSDDAKSKCTIYLQLQRVESDKGIHKGGGVFGLETIA